MYTIGNIIYGHDLQPFLEEHGEDELLGDLEHCGIVKHYSGALRVSPTAFGIELDGFDECSYVSVAKLKQHPTPEQEEQYRKNIVLLMDEIKTMVKDYPETKEYWDKLLEVLDGKPDVFILWSTS